MSPLLPMNPFSCFLMFLHNLVHTISIYECLCLFCVFLKTLMNIRTKYELLSEQSPQMIYGLVIGKDGCTLQVSVFYH